MEYALVVRWLGGFLLLGLLALPATAALFAPLEARGSGFAVHVGTAVLTLSAFWLGHLWFGPSTAVLAVLLLGSLSAVALRAGYRPDLRRYGETAVVFALVFCLAALIRSADPAIQAWAEGSLNYGLLQSILRADALPPEDMWFAGEPVQYYYGGHLAVALWTTLTATPARFAPNLAVPALYAMLATGGYELAGAIGRDHGLDRRASGLVAALLFALGGNAYEAIRILHGALPADSAGMLRESLALSADALGSGFAAFDATHFAGFPTDLPIYLVRIGSLHAHVASQPYTLLAAGILFAATRTDPANRRARLARLGAVAPVAGLVELTNAWSLPTVLGLVALAVAFAPDSPGTLLPDRVSLDGLPAGPVWTEAGRYVGGVAAAVLVGLVGLAVAAPFVLGTDVTRPLAVLPDRTSWPVYVVGYGIFLAAIAAGFWPHLRRRASRSDLLLPLFFPMAIVLHFDLAVLLFVLPVLLAAWYLCRRDDAVGFEGVLVLAGAGLLVLVEVIYLSGGAASGRYNTVYKVHSQVWLLWGVASSVLLARLFARAGVGRAGRVVDRDRIRSVLAPDGAGDAALAGVAALILVSSLLFGVLTVGATLEERPEGGEATLDATAFVERSHHSHARAIDWLDDRQGQPTILAAAPNEADVQTFRANPASSFTGLPTVAGWTHAADYHSADAYDRRTEHVRTVYEGDAAARAEILRRYDVEYVYLGPYERERYDVSLTAGPALEPREFGDVTVYAVDHDSLARRS